MVSSFAWRPVAVVPLSVRVAPKVVIVWASETSRSDKVSVESFDKSCRLLSAGDFSGVFAARRVLRGDHFVLHYRPGAGAFARLGLAIPKKQARTAVLRNAIKRQARELFRRHHKGLPVTDIVLRLAQPLGQTRPDRANKAVWREEISVLFHRLRREQSI